MLEHDDLIPPPADDAEDEEDNAEAEAESSETKSNATSTATEPAEIDEDKGYGVVIEEIDACKRSITITIAPAKVSGLFNDQYKELNKSIRIDGFRQGKAPRQLLEKRFGNEVKDEVRDKIVGETFQEIVDDNKFEVLDEPDPEFEPAPDDMPASGKTFTFKVSFEVHPQFELKTYKGLKIKRPNPTVTDEMVEKEVDHIRLHKAELKELDDKAKAKVNDLLQVNLTITAGEGDDAEEIIKLEDKPVLVNEGQIRGIKIDKKQGDLTGLTKGDKKTYTSTLPDEFPNHGGKPVTIDVEVLAVKRRELPEIDEEFVKGFGVDSVDEWNTKMREEVEQQRKQWCETETMKRAVDALVAQYDFPMPKEFVDKQLENWEQQQRMQMLQQQVPFNVIETQLEAQREKNREEFVDTVRAMFLLEAIGKKERIFVTEDDIEARITEMAAGYGMPPEAVRNYLEEQDSLGQLRANMREERIKAYLVKHAEVTEEEPGESMPTPDHDHDHESDDDHGDHDHDHDHDHDDDANTNDEAEADKPAEPAAKTGKGKAQKG